MPIDEIIERVDNIGPSAHSIAPSPHLWTHPLSQDRTHSPVWDEASLRRAIAAADVALWSWNVDSDRLTMDESGYRLWGIPVSESVAFEDLSSHIHPADRDRAGAAFAATRATTGAYEIDFRVLIGETVQWVSARGQGADGGMAGRVMLGIFIDVTGRKQAESILSELDGTLRQTLQAIGQQPRFRGTEIFVPAIISSKTEDGLEQALARAVERNELSLMYQPIVDRSGVVTAGVEALLRWQYNGQPVSPAVFIPVAERTGSIHEIGTWVLRQACLDARAWPGLHLSVNVSALQFGAPDLAERIGRIVQETRFDWKRLELEITETALLTGDQVFQVMNELRDKGASFALDDFGTGYASLTCLSRFPFDKIKIDRSFIADVTANASIIHAVISIGRSLGLKVVAEGVESTDQQRFLTAAGVHYMQGYLFGQPVAVEEINDRLSQERQMIKLPVRK
jgi:EAL domain-containing protein (putative c-di-GMP-specific phosphodiesterase class I)